jgi:hypothetical protein
MKTRIVIAALVLLAATGCQRGGVTPAPPVNAAPVIAGQEGKDRAIISEAAKIDAIAPAAKPHTDAQRAAIAAAPAADVARIVAEFESQIGQLVRSNADKDAQILAAKNQALREQARWLTWTGVALLAAFGLSLLVGQLAAAVKTWPLALLGVGCFGLAQLISHPWFLRGFILLLIAAVAYSAYYVFDRHKEGRLRRSLEKKAEVLTQIVPVLDEAYDSAADSVKQALDANIFGRLSSVFSKEQKSLVHQVRAETKAAT